MKRDPMFHELKTYPPPPPVGWCVTRPALCRFKKSTCSCFRNFDYYLTVLIYPNLPQFTILQNGWFFPGSDNKNIRWCIAIFLTLHILIFGYINTIFLILESVTRSVWCQTGRFVVVFLYRGNVRMVLVYVIYEQGSDMTIFVFHTMVHLIQYC